MLRFATLFVLLSTAAAAQPNLTVQASDVRLGVSNDVEELIPGDSEEFEVRGVTIPA